MAREGLEWRKKLTPATPAHEFKFGKVPEFSGEKIPSPEFFQYMGAVRGGMTYLASPYKSHGKVAMSVAKTRAKATLHLTIRLLDAGICVFSPIVYGTPFDNAGLARSSEWWLKRDIEFLRRCDSLTVHALPGWRESPGVLKEMDWALLNQKPIYVVRF